MADKIPHNALVVVADGTGARFFRNAGHGDTVALAAEGEVTPANLRDDGPAGKRPTESSPQETDEATFAKQLAHELNRRALPRRLCGPCPHRRPSDLGPNPPDVA